MDALSIIPPVVAIAVVLWRKEVIVALLLAIFSAELLQVAFAWHAPGFAALHTVDRITGVFSNPDNARILVFSFVIGALLAYIRVSGGIAAVVDTLINKGIASNARRTSLLTSAVGVVVFIESNLSVLASGILSRGLFDRHGLSRAKLAYIIDSTSAPVCILVLLNAWGAFVLVLLGQYDFGMSAPQVLWSTVPLNFYALVTLGIVAWTSVTQRWFGPIARTKPGVGMDVHLEEDIEPSRPYFMVLPLAIMIFGMLGFMLWTGGGNLAEGSGSKSILYATVLAAAVAYILMLASRRFDHVRLVKIAMQGMGDLLPLVIILLLALALGQSLKDLGTGAYIAGLVSDNLPVFLIPAMLFLAGALVSFSTGTSWGTFAILIPLGMPIAMTLDLSPSLLLAAILGGGVFGDHCSPISDTTAVSSIASGCDLLEHVRTQLPYALAGGIIAFVMYLVAGFVLL
ncbi:MAG: sodium:proton antiporter [Gammaproteobacteria bacterium]|nr:sodium:proton antiporter [Gammaproteobacteria bacterium]NNF49276.1 sodium:proton antiporter [Woeseiaceae bacterium]MBT8095318.1 sodium:proton antiporter [Gammaproteobacteria bacterium]MBT8105740.1 sodium:proton antiporter [Gammaproteobacteria bacterium]NNK25754.1 sodium:proton antiporter [Woeseiaceae bacterium]